MSFGPGGLNASEVHVGTTPATAVYLGSEKVWPIYTPQQSPWYKFDNNNGQTLGNNIPWPAGAEFVDVIMVGGGAGGTGTGVGGNPQKGGGSGEWQGFTIPRIEAKPVSGTYTYTSLNVRQTSYSGQDGVGGGNFNTEAADGKYIIASGVQGGVGGNNKTGSSALDKTSNTNNRNGGNVPETFTFNGRTYTMASYGANAGRGGATSNKNGGPGNAPGGGGQSADNGGLTGYSGGNGANGAFILYWY